MEKKKVPLTIDFTQISDKYPFGRVVEWKPNMSVQKTRTKAQIKKRQNSKLGKISRKFNAFISKGKQALYNINK